MRPSAGVAGQATEGQSEGPTGAWCIVSPSVSNPSTCAAAFAQARTIAPRRDRCGHARVVHVGSSARRLRPMRNAPSDVTLRRCGWRRVTGDGRNRAWCVWAATAQVSPRRQAIQPVRVTARALAERGSWMKATEVRRWGHTGVESSPDQSMRFAIGELRDFSRTMSGVIDPLAR